MKNNMLQCISKFFNSLGFANLWIIQFFVNLHLCLDILLVGIFDQFEQEWRSKISSVVRFNYYKLFMLAFSLGNYKFFLNQSGIRLLARAPLGAVRLGIGEGKLQRINKDYTNRNCNVCNINVTEDLYHFQLVCLYRKEK